MNEPKRLLETGSPRLRALVLAGKRDSPDARTEASVLGALGLAAAGGAALATPGAAHAAGRSALKTVLAGLRHVAFSKVGIGMIAAVAAGSSGYLAGRSQERAIRSEPTGRVEMVAKSEPREALAARAAGNTSAPRSAPLSASAVNAAVPAALPSAASLPAAHGETPPAASAGRPTGHGTALESSASSRSGASPGRLRAPEAVAPPSEVPPSIAEQLESIRRARSRVQEGDGTAALRELDAYVARSPRGTFEEEALALRVRALRLSGDSAGAARELANLASRFPASVHLAALAGPGGAL